MNVPARRTADGHLTRASRPRRPRALRTLLLAAAVLAPAAACSTQAAATTVTSPATTRAHAAAGTAARNVVPVPTSIEPATGTFAVTDATRILTPADSAEAGRVGRFLAALLRRSTGYPLPVSIAGGAATNALSLELTPDAGLGAEGYELVVNPESATLRAHAAEGLFRGVQTLRQLLPARVEASTVQPGPWEIPAGRIADHPRFAWRGAALDVARHFFTVDEVKRYIDALALYKVNMLHLHLSDDQGWRIAVTSWPRLATYGGSTEVGGGPGGYYTQQQYSDLVKYAQDRYLTVVPEIDVPGHTNAALASYAELNCDGKAPPLYTGTDVGFSALCVTKPVTYQFLDQVFGELAALTPGAYLHIGGDEVKKLTKAQYAALVERAQQIVQAHGKKLVGWAEIVAAKLSPTSVAQYWNPDGSADAIRRAAGNGTRFVLSPANKIYLDMKYNKDTQLGQDWAGLVEVRDAYDWDPATLIGGVPEASILGVEAPIWSETMERLDQVEFMAFPRLAGAAEIGWSAAKDRKWSTYRPRLAAQGPRWAAMSVTYYRSSQVPWPK